jgi:hypothetical protein
LKAPIVAVTLEKKEETRPAIIEPADDDLKDEPVPVV